MYACMHICTASEIDSLLSTLLDIHTYIHMYIHTYVHTYRHTHTHIQAWINISSRGCKVHYMTFIHTYKHTYIHTYSRTHKYIHTSMHKHTSMLLSSPNAAFPRNFAREIDTLLSCGSKCSTCPSLMGGGSWSSVPGIRRELTVRVGYCGLLRVTSWSADTCVCACVCVCVCMCVCVGRYVCAEHI